TPVPNAGFPAGTGLVYDFDNGLAANDALGFFSGINHLGLGDAEGFAAPGDSGGPGFLNDGAIASVVSYGFGFQTNPPDVLPGTSDSFGEVELDTRVSPFAGWINGVVGAAGNLVNGGFETGDFTGWDLSGNTGFTGVSAINPHSGTYAAFLGPIGSLGFLCQ